MSPCPRAPTDRPGQAPRWGRAAAGLALWVGLLAAPALAQGEKDPLSQTQKAQLERLRTELAGQLQLRAFDLLDELVFGWTRSPPFGKPTPVVLASMGMPVGFGSGLGALVENHFAALVTKNPQANLMLVHCPECTELIVHAGAKGTIISRGLDQPEALGKLGALSQAHHALYLDFEAEGAALVLRARLVTLEPLRPIVYAKTLSSATSAAALLRAPEQLKSAEDARAEYLEALRGQGLFLVPVRVGIRTYAESSNSSVQGRPFPYPWLQLGLEAALTRARAWTGAVGVGITHVPELQTGYLAQARIARLLSGSSVSLTRPDVYGFFGASVISIHGPGALLFSSEIPTAKQLLDAATGAQKPNEVFATFQFGAELRVKNRMGLSLYLESVPALNDAPGVGTYADFGLIQFHSLGAEVSFCF